MTARVANQAVNPASSVSNPIVRPVLMRSPPLLWVWSILT
jgi:hypothetical protein